MPFAPHDKSPCYNNNNTAILRLLLPKADGATTEDPDRLAKPYVRIVQKRVFEPVGATAVECKPPPTGHAALCYRFPGGNPGEDWGDQTERCGAEGWNLSVEDMGKVLNSLNAGIGKPLTPRQFTDMEKTHMGWDMVATNGGFFVRGAAPPSGFRYLEKNGGLTSGQNALSTSALICGGSAGTATSPAVRGFVAVLFMNSDVTREPNIGAADVMFQAFARNAMKK